MHPIMISEFYQAKRGVMQTVVFITIIGFTSRYLLGDTGLMIMLFFVLPIYLNLAGIGTFAEEFSKDYYRFLFHLPVRRTGIWLIKISFGLIMGVAAALPTCLSMKIEPLPFFEADMIDNLRMNSMSIFYVVFGVALYFYAAGVFSVCCCVVSNNAFALSIILSYYPLVIFSLGVTLLGYEPRINDFPFIYTAAAIPLLLGALVIFLNRNPYLPQKWKWRMMGVIFKVLSIVIFICACLGCFNWNKKHSPNYTHGVYGFSPSPDGKYFYVYAHEYPFVEYSYILDENGNLVSDLGCYTFPHYFVFFSPESPPSHIMYHQTRPLIPWSELISFSQEIYREDGLTLAERIPIYYPPYILLNLNTGKKHFLANINHHTHTYYYSYHRIWSQDGRYVYGLKIKGGEGFKIYRLFRQDIISGQTHLLEPYSNKPGMSLSLYYLQENILQLIESNEDNQEENPQKIVSIVYRDAKKTFSYQIPPDIEQWDVNPQGEYLVLLRQIKDESWKYELVIRWLENEKEFVVLNFSQIPMNESADPEREPHFYASFDFSPSGRYFLCSGTIANRQIYWLIDSTLENAQKIFAFDGEDYNFRHYFFSRDESKIYFIWSKKWDSPKHIQVYDISQNRFSFKTPIILNNCCDEFHFLNNNHLLYLNNESSYLNRLCVLDLKNGTTKPFFNPDSHLNNSRN